MTESMQLSCEKEQNTGVVYDPRYKYLPAFFATEASVQRENGVIDLIRSIHPELVDKSGIINNKAES